MFNYIRRKYHPLWRLRKLSGYRTFQNWIDFPVSIKNGSIRFFVMLLRDFSLIANSKGWEMETHRIFEKVLTHFHITHVIDIGSNVGTFAWHALNVNHNLKVLLFEPDVTNIRLLKKTIKSNRFNNISLWEGVVSDKDGEMEFLVDNASGATGSIKNDSSNASSLHHAYNMSFKTLVRSISIDTYMQSVFVEKNSSLMKIDVEGAELEVLTGAKSFIKKFRPFVIVECFDLENLTPLIDAEYVVYPLAENCNYFLIPKEIEEFFNKSKIIENAVKTSNA